MLVLCKSLRLVTVKTLADDEKYSLLYKENLTQPIQILLTQKRKNFSHFFSVFLKSTLNFAHFQKKDDPHSRCISQITVSEKGEQINVCKMPFQRSLQKKHGKRAQRPLKSAQRYLYHICSSLWTSFGWKKSMLVL